MCCASIGNILVEKENKKTLNNFSFLASALMVNGEYEKALELYNLVLEGQEKHLGKRHPDTLLTIHDLGKLFHAPKSSKPEAVYSSSGKANRFKAMRAWIKSPSHRGIALKLGITVCRGGYCTRRNFR